MIVGFIQFSIAGGQVENSSYKTSGVAFDAVSDENSIVFTGTQSYEIALKIILIQLMKYQSKFLFQMKLESLKNY